LTAQQTRLLVRLRELPPEQNARVMDFVDFLIWKQIRLRPTP